MGKINVDLLIAYIIKYGHSESGSIVAKTSSGGTLTGFIVKVARFSTVEPESAVLD